MPPEAPAEWAMWEWTWAYFASCLGLQFSTYLAFHKLNESATITHTPLLLKHFLPQTPLTTSLPHKSALNNRKIHLKHFISFNRSRQNNAELDTWQMAILQNCKHIPFIFSLFNVYAYQRMQMVKWYSLLAPVLLYPLVILLFFSNYPVFLGCFYI